MVKKVTVLLSLVLLVSFTGCTNSVGKINEINQSPSGSYQIDEVNWSGGATAGESYLVIESPADGVFSGKGDNEPASGIRIEETRYSYATDFTVMWESDSSFISCWARPQSDTFNVARVDITDGGYEIALGDVYLDRDNSYLSGFEIVDDDVYITCNLRITNESSESVRFTIDARAAAEDIGQLLSDGSLTVVNDEDESQVFEIAANSSEMFTVVFRGSKGSTDAKADRKLPPRIYLHYYA